MQFCACLVNEEWKCNKTCTVYLYLQIMGKRSTEGSEIDWWITIFYLPAAASSAWARHIYLAYLILICELYIHLWPQFWVPPTLSYVSVMFQNYLLTSRHRWNRLLWCFSWWKSHFTIMDFSKCGEFLWTEEKPQKKREREMASRFVFRQKNLSLNHNESFDKDWVDLHVTSKYSHTRILKKCPVSCRLSK